jgi:hypothetical protein
VYDGDPISETPGEVRIGRRDQERPPFVLFCTQERSQKTAVTIGSGYLGRVEEYQIGTQNETASQINPLAF